MTYPVFPADLPPPLVQGFSYESGEGRLGFRNDSGPPSLSQRFSATTDIMPASLMLDRQQLGQFDYFYTVDTEKGSKLFVMSEPLTDGWPMLDEEGVPLLDENDEVMLYSEMMLVAFADGGLPRRELIGGINFRVSFRLMRYPTE